MGKKIFISYHKNQLEFVQKLEADLEKAGFESWVAATDLAPGLPWRQTTFDALLASDVVIACLSPEYLEHENRHDEIYLAFCFNKQIIPVMVQPCFTQLINTPEMERLGDLFIIDFASLLSMGLKLTYEDCLAHLLDSINPKPETVPLNTEQLYISYSTIDAEFATRLARDLKRSRGNVWIATLSFQGGDDWQAKQTAAMMRTDSLIVCLSPEAARSDQVRREVLLARIRGIPIIPVVTERAYQDKALMEEMNTVMAESFDMRALQELNWALPRPDYQNVLDDLRKAFKLAVNAAELEKRRQRIFLSYRRADSRDVTGRIYDRLVEHFSLKAVFKDVDNIPPA